MALAAVLLGALSQPAREPGTAVFGTSFTREEPSTLGFPVGWYSGLGLRGDLPAIAADGMGAVMPYHSAYSHTAPYLDAAQALGVKVLLEVPRTLVKEVDTAGVAAYVATHRAHPALLGWYVADEPSVNTALGPLSPSNAATLYATIKQTDVSHPVAMTFSPVENPAPYRDAFDVMMADDYPSRAGSPEFSGLDAWTIRVAARARMAQEESDFFPVIQAYGGTDTEPVFGRRYPTAAEERYMVFASLQMGATGVFFWTHYRADPSWVDQVIEPIVSVLNEMRPALVRGERTRSVRSRREDVRATAYRDPTTGATYVVAVHYGDGTVRAPIELRRGLRLRKAATRLGPEPRRVRIRDGYLPQRLGPYGVNVFRLR